MKKPERYQARSFSTNSKISAQSSIEFVLAFVMCVLFLYLATNLFVYLNHSLVQRQRDYDASRVAASSSPATDPTKHSAGFVVEGEP